MLSQWCTMDAGLVWLGFLVSIAILLILSRKNMGLALVSAGVALGLFTLPLVDIGVLILTTITDPSIALLALAMGIIPLIGGVMEESGQMKGIVENLRIGKKPFLALSPALVGMLPMPGGALLSAPLVDRGGQNIDGGTKAAVNVWFRHILFLIYPLGPALIASAKIAGLSVYEVLPYLFPAFLLMFLVGYAFFFKGVGGKLTYSKSFSLKRLLIPLMILLAAPFIDFSLQTLLELPVAEI